MGFIGIGAVEALTAHAGRWLQVRPKAASGRSRTLAFGRDGEMIAALPRDDVDPALETLDAPLRERFAAAYKDGRKLRYVARLGEDGSARVGLQALADDDVLLGGQGSDNRVAIWSDRYRRQPLLIQGPGAGAAVTAAALLDDTLRIAAGER